MPNQFKAVFILWLAVYFTSCGYALRGDARPFFENHHIHTLYISPVKNNSYKAGVEITVYNALRKRISEGGYVRMVDSMSSADARFDAFVQDASTIPYSLTTASALQTANPIVVNQTTLPPGPTTVLVSSGYNVTLNVRFQLTDLRSGKVLWADTLTRSKVFIASTYIGNLGNTSALINDSEFEKTLVELSANVVTDAEESVNTIF